MQSHTDDHFNRRRFVKANMQAISRIGFSESFAQNNWQPPKPRSVKKNPGDGNNPPSGIIRL
jgi:hypothetical protein